MHAAGARGLGPADQTQVVERRPDHGRHLSNLGPLDAGHRVEIHAQLIGMIQLVGPDRMRMQLEAGEVGHPDQRGRIAGDHLLGSSAGGELEGDDLDPGRT
jgi:hypothetical protein